MPDRTRACHHRRVSDPSEPEDTLPFTHRPYGDHADDNPFVSPSGPAAEPSGPSYSTPPPLPPMTVEPVPSVPYGPPVPGQEWGQGWGQQPVQQPWPATWAPAYGVGYAGTVEHKGARTALVLGIFSVTSLVLAFICCITIPGVLCGPFAWYFGAKAKREIEARPGTYANLSAAVTGMWMGVVTSVVGFLVIAGITALSVVIGVTQWSLV